jgi:hypothetical protein
MVRMQTKTKMEETKMATKKKAASKKSKKVEQEAIMETVEEMVLPSEETVEAAPVIKTVETPVVVEATETPDGKPSVEEQLLAFKEKLLANLNSPELELPFFSEVMFDMIAEEGKIVNAPGAIRVSQYHSLPSQMPYDPEQKSNGFGGKRGRMFFSLCMNKSADEVIQLETFNRKKEGNNRLEPILYRRTLAAMAKGYFPEIHKEFKTKYPIGLFKPAAPVAVVIPAETVVEETVEAG